MDPSQWQLHHYDPYHHRSKQISSRRRILCSLLTKEVNAKLNYAIRNKTKVHKHWPYKKVRCNLICLHYKYSGTLRNNETNNIYAQNQGQTIASAQLMRIITDAVLGNFIFKQFCSNQPTVKALIIQWKIHALICKNSIISKNTFIPADIIEVLAFPQYLAWTLKNSTRKFKNSNSYRSIW